jgi:hypothetical protein
MQRLNDSAAHGLGDAMLGVEGWSKRLPLYYAARNVFRSISPAMKLLLARGPA